MRNVFFLGRGLVTMFSLRTMFLFAYVHTLCSQAENEDYEKSCISPILLYFQSYGKHLPELVQIGTFKGRNRSE